MVLVLCMWFLSNKIHSSLFTPMLKCCLGMQVISYSQVRLDLPIVVAVKITIFSNATP
jgi:hypothetical protein